ncbi:unnamed protein product [Vitrella brassicaformis CCMP3155]|uniref:Uncharacterized protein n=2 Tax=Vitrella brassicaformis TaxID=1169539 RepID=A0A0G4FMZ5_VITBC|nr:unnamed protein product [Vitrella brassicaformis CCMP3155]|eukprot:CEM15214.1 unnamed protein product [Vitrella brassicaformis CCMP3155]
MPSSAGLRDRCLVKPLTTTDRQVSRLIVVLAKVDSFLHKTSSSLLPSREAHPLIKELDRSMASVWRLPIVLLLLSVALSLPSSAAFVRPIRLTQTGPIRLAHQPQPTPTSSGGRPLTALSAGRSNLYKHLSQRDIACVNVGALLIILVFQFSDIIGPILLEYISAVDISLSSPEIVAKLASVEVDAVAVPSRLPVIAVLVPAILYWWNKIPESNTIPRDRDVPADVRLLENSWTKPRQEKKGSHEAAGLSWSMAGVQVKDPLALSLMAAYFAVATSFWRSTVASWWKDVVDDE